MVDVIATPVCESLELGEEIDARPRRRVLFLFGVVQGRRGLLGRHHAWSWSSCCPSCWHAHRLSSTNKTENAKSVKDQRSTINNPQHQENQKSEINNPQYQENQKSEIDNHQHQENERSTIINIKRMKEKKDEKDCGIVGGKERRREKKGWYRFCQKQKASRKRGGKRKRDHKTKLS